MFLETMAEMLFKLKMLKMIIYHHIICVFPTMLIYLLTLPEFYLKLKLNIEIEETNGVNQ